MANSKRRKAPSSSTNDPNLIIVLPGDNVTEHIEFPEQKEGSSTQLPKLGLGLRYEKQQQVFATLAGRLEQRGRTYFVRTNTKRFYHPFLEDRVVGIVEERLGSDPVAGGDYYRINIGGSHPAVLNTLSFEGATKRNRPNLSPGMVLYCRIAELNSSNALDPTLSCIVGPHDGGIPRKEWRTNESCYGELRGGTVVRISTGLARELLQPDNVVLEELSSFGIAFEVAVGVNGYLWIHSSAPEYTVAIQNAIMNSEVLPERQVRAMVKSLVYTVQKQIQKNLDAMEE